MRKLTLFLCIALLWGGPLTACRACNDCVQPKPGWYKFSEVGIMVGKYWYAFTKQGEKFTIDDGAVPLARMAVILDAWVYVDYNNDYHNLSLSIDHVETGGR